MDALLEQNAMKITIFKLKKKINIQILINSY
jgi:hypothetical protein